LAEHWRSCLDPGWNPSDRFAAQDAIRKTQVNQSSVYNWLRELQVAGAVAKVSEHRGRSGGKYELTGQSPDLTVKVLPAPADVFPDYTFPPSFSWNDRNNG
jgi:hypothetical protein